MLPLLLTLLLLLVPSSLSFAPTTFLHRQPTLLTATKEVYINLPPASKGISAQMKINHSDTSSLVEIRAKLPFGLDGEILECLDSFLQSRLEAPPVSSQSLLRSLSRSELTTRKLMPNDNSQSSNVARVSQSPTANPRALRFAFSYHQLNLKTVQ